MPISEHHLEGLRDLLCNESNTPPLLQLARSVTRNMCVIEEPEEALGYLTSHFQDIHQLLHKRLITRDLLYTYLHAHVPGTSINFTKADLITKVIQYWDEQFSTENIQSNEAASEHDTPIHAIARQFSDWFFTKYNSDTLILSDLWSDASLQMKVIGESETGELVCDSAQSVLDSLFMTKRQFGLHFNPNLAHSGVQGRIDSYGHVIVLCCGTLHTTDHSIGIFEFTFGLLRDPHECNNWKPKKLKCLLRNEKHAPQLHTLADSVSLQEALALSTQSTCLD